MVIGRESVGDAMFSPDLEQGAVGDGPGSVGPGEEILLVAGQTADSHGRSPSVLIPASSGDSRPPVLAAELLIESNTLSQEFLSISG